jgi:hypothetical protein
MATKEELVGNIKGWMQIDEEIRVLNRELKERRAQKKALTESLVTIMKDNEICIRRIRQAAFRYPRKYCG